MAVAKKGFAVEFIKGIRSMESAELDALVLREAGEELAQFFLQYSATLIARDPDRVIENTSSLMLMGIPDPRRGGAARAGSRAAPAVDGARLTGSPRTAARRRVLLNRGGAC